MTSGALAWWDGATLALCVALALAGIARRLARLRRLRALGAAITDPLDRDYLESVKRSTHLRLWVKLVILALLLAPRLLEDPLLLVVTRLAIISALVAMLVETAATDRIRDRLGRGEAAAQAHREQADRVEAMGMASLKVSRDTNERLRRGEIGDGQKAVVDRAQADEIQRVGDDTNRVVHEQQEDKP